MRLLISETWRYPIYGEILFKRFMEIGVEVFAFKEGSYFDRAGPIDKLLGRAQYKYRFGRALNRLNAALRAEVKKNQIEAALFVRGDMIYPETLRELREENVYIMGCNNDNPFSTKNPPYIWRHLLRGLPHYNYYFAYRESNVKDFLHCGCGGARVWRSYYIREINYPIEDTGNSPYTCDVSFIGHWENDGREEYVAPLIQEKSIRFGLWGTLWERAKNYKLIRERLGEIKALNGPDYNLAINSSKISLVFLSGLNCDTYTRRCFEITAAGTFMLAPRNDDLRAIFKEGVEAEYYGSPDEMLYKIRFYLKNDAQRKAIARAGRERVVRDGHEAADRVRTLVEHLNGAVRPVTAAVRAK